MRVTFVSSHVDGAYGEGVLTLGIRIEDDEAELTTWDTVEFSVPPDFHAHNDAVAAALMTLAGRRFQEVQFNFPISARCAATLREFYGEVAIGPVDPTATAREPGRRLAVNFSGVEISGLGAPARTASPIRLRPRGMN